MRSRMRKVLFILFIGAAGTVLCSSRGSSNIEEKLYTGRIPRRIGQWRGVDAEIPGWATDILGTEDVIIRAYARNNKDIVNLNVTFALDRPRTFYPPDYCHIGVGWEPESKEIASFEAEYKGRIKVRAVKLLLRKDRKWVVSLYWFKSGSRTTASYLKQQLDIVLNRIKHGEASGALIQVFAKAEADDLKAAEKNVREFAGLVFPIIQENLP
ncbi:exosortase C-terminal domain/associated protein EpsI [Candidatus Omnitrophota bacterium]